MKDSENYKSLTLNAYDNSAREYAKNTDALHPAEKAHQFQTLLPGKRILDLGCGPGRDAKVFVDQGFEVVGVDLSPKMIELARSKVDAEFHVMDIENLEFPSNHFDGIWASASLLHVPKKNMLQVFKTLHSLLVEGGILFFSLKKGCGESLQPDQRYGDVMKFWSFFEKNEIEEIVQHASFQVIDSVIVEKKIPYKSHPLWINVLCKKRQT